MTTLDATILGAVQGLTEFLPISSSGHLILARDLLGLPLAGSLAFDAILQCATALAIVVYFRNDVLRLFSWQFATADSGTGFFLSGPTARLYQGIVLATLPVIGLGLLLENLMNTVFRSAGLVALTLVAGSAIMYAAERWGNVDASQNGTPTWRNSFLIGLFQSLALIPGMSRSGMTIAGGMLLGLSREQAARFGFLIAIPILLGSGAKKMLELAETGVDRGELAALAVGAFVSFAVGLAVIHYLLRYLRTHSLMIFIWYRLALAVGILLVMML